MTTRRILLIQLACFGDCLYATTVARQIKADHPGCHLTWAISNKYRSVLNHNPDVDDVWEVLLNDDYAGPSWTSFYREANERKARGEFDDIVVTQIPPDNWKRYNGTIRSSIFRGYPSPITIPVEPVISLSDKEIENVKQYAVRSRLDGFKNVVLIECSPGSAQSFLNVDMSVAIAKDLIGMDDSLCVVLSTHKKIDLGKTERIFDCAELSFRENAELTKYCTLLIGGSSGITWLSTSAWAKKLDMVQLLERRYPLFAGVKYDFEKWKLSTHNVIEITKNDHSHIVLCLRSILESGFHSAKKQFDEVYKPEYFNFREVVGALIWRGRKRDIPYLIKGYAAWNPHLGMRQLRLQAIKTLLVSNKIIATILTRIRPQR